MARRERPYRGQRFFASGPRAFRDAVADCPGPLPGTNPRDDPGPFAWRWHWQAGGRPTGNSRATGPGRVDSNGTARTGHASGPGQGACGSCCSTGTLKVPWPAAQTRPPQWPGGWPLQVCQSESVTEGTATPARGVFKFHAAPRVRKSSAGNFEGDCGDISTRSEADIFTHATGT